MVILIFKESEELNLNKVLSMLTNKSLAIREVTEERDVLSFPDLKILPNQQRVMFKNREVILTHTEFQVLLHMAQRPGQIFSHSQLYDAAYERSYGIEGVDNIIYGIVKGLRKKIEINSRHPRYIHTVRCAGYKFEALPEE